MLRKIRLKKGLVVLETIVKILPKVIIFIILVGVFYIILNPLLNKNEVITPMDSNLELAKQEIMTIKEGESNPVAALKGNYQYHLFPKDSTVEAQCKGEPCLCILNLDTKERKCEILPKRNFKLSCAKPNDQQFFTISQKNKEIFFEGTC